MKCIDIDGHYLQCQLVGLIGLSIHLYLHAGYRIEFLVERCQCNSFTYPYVVVHFRSVAIGHINDFDTGNEIVRRFDVGPYYFCSFAGCDGNLHVGLLTHKNAYGVDFGFNAYLC